MQPRREKISHLGKQITMFLDTIARQYSSKLLTTQSYPASSAASGMSQWVGGGGEVSRKYYPLYHYTEQGGPLSAKQARGYMFTVCFSGGCWHLRHRMWSVLDPIAQVSRQMVLFLFCPSPCQKQFKKLSGGKKERREEKRKKRWMKSIKLLWGR